MTNTTLTLLAAGSLRSAFLPLVAHFSAAHWPGGRCAVWPCRPAARADRSRVAVRGFCFRQRGAPAGAAAGGSGAGMPGICQQPADADRPAVSRITMAWTGWRCSARPACGWRPPRRAAIRREIIPGSCSPELRHAIQGWATRWPGGRSSWSAAETHRACRRER